MTFDEFQELNARRCREVWAEELRDWTLDDWSHALSAEVGEVSEVFIRVKQGRLPAVEKRAALLSELADVICFADLMITALQANTQDSVMAKFHAVSARKKWPYAGSLLSATATCRNCEGRLFIGMKHTCPHRNIAPLGAIA